MPGISPRLSPPSLKDNTADVDRLIKGIRKGLGDEEMSVGFAQIRGVTRSLRNHDYAVSCSCHIIKGSAFDSLYFELSFLSSF